MQKLISLFLLIIAGAGMVRAQEGGLAFLRIPPDAASMGMGDAGVAYTRNAFATYWNPAGLAATSTNQGGLSYQSWVANVTTYTLATRFRAGAKGGLGLFVTASGVTNLEFRDRPGEPQGTFDAQNVAAGLAYGRAFGPLRMGATAKFLREEIFTDRATGYAIDGGMQVTLLNDDLHLGLALQNVGEMNALASKSTRLPRTLRGGVAVSPFRLRARDDAETVLKALLVAEVSHNLTDEQTQYHAGAAAQVLDLLILRAGYLTNDELRDVSFGLGLRSGTLAFDYALLPFSDGFGGPGHVFTLHYGW
jgi:hypothetical protein